MTYFKLVGVAVVVVLGIVVAALIFIGSSDDDGDSNGVGATPLATEPSSTTTGSGEPTVQPRTASPTPAQGGEEAALEIPEAGGEVTLAAGNYRTSRFQPQARFSVGDGWSASLDTPRLVQLFRGDDPEANCVCLINPDGVVDDNDQVVALPGAGTVDDLIEWLTGNSDLATSNPSSLQVGNLSGRQLDVELSDDAPGDEVDYLAAGSERFAVKSGERQHLTVLDYRGAPLIIAQRSPADEYSDYFVFVEEIVGGLTFAN